MMTDHPNHDVLIAYVDGQLTGDMLKAAETLVRNDQAAASYVAQLRQSALPYAQAFANELEHPVRQSLIDEITDTSLVGARAPADPKYSRYSYFATAAAVCAGLVVGALAMYLLHSRVPQDNSDSWIAQVANYQRLYVRPTIANADVPVRLTLDELTIDNLGIKVIEPDLSAQGLTFKRGQLLQVNGSPLVQFAYLPELGSPVALCIKRGKLVATTDVRYGQSHGLAYGVWQRDDLSFMVVGELSEADVREITQAAMKQLVSS